MQSIDPFDDTVYQAEAQVLFHGAVVEDARFTGRLVGVGRTPFSGCIEVGFEQLTPRLPVLEVERLSNLYWYPRWPTHQPPYYLQRQPSHTSTMGTG